MSNLSTYEKIENLMEKFNEVDDELGAFEGDEDEANDVEAYQLTQRRRRLLQKLRKQMAKFLQETETDDL